MKKLMRKMRERKGFTLAELLIVVAIIAVLVAISIPIFTAQLEKANQATDAANIRAAYAEAVVKSLDTGADASVTTAKMKSGSWDKLTDLDYIGTVSIGTITKTKGSTKTVKVTASSGAVTIN